MEILLEAGSLPVAILLTISWRFAALASGQSLPATPHTPDLLGLYPGMPSLAARAQLQKPSSDVLCAGYFGDGFGMTSSRSPRIADQVSVSS